MLRKAARNAADTAILAVAARTDLDTLAKRQQFAQRIFDLQFSARHGDVTNTQIAISEQQGAPTTQISGNLLYNTYLLEMFGIPTLPINFISETIHRNLEVVLVLDNSGSLSPTDIQTMQDAAELLIDIAFDSAPAGQSVKVSVVPFAGTVNIGPITNQQEQSWIDGGNGSMAQSTYHGHWFIHAEQDLLGNVTVDPNRKVNHLDLFNSVGPQRNDWQGCVEARPHPFDVNDAPPNSSNPITKWVPQFWPDAAECRAHSYTKNVDQGACKPANSSSLGGAVSERSNAETDNYDFVWDRSFLVENDTAKSFYQDYINAIAISKKDNPKRWQSRFGKSSLTEDEIRLGYVGVWDSATSKYIGKYNHATGRVNYTGRSNGNRGCGAALSPLSNRKHDAKGALDNMTAQLNGGTSITTGIMWGLRVLSPGEPFTEGAPFDDGNTHKVMVLMSDGGNWYSGGPLDTVHVGSELTAYGFLGADRLGDILNSPGNRLHKLVDVMDDKTEVACNLIKDNGVEIYTVTLNDQLNEPNGIMLSCATSPQHTHVATLDNATTLDQAFRDIARKMTAPYLSK